jgi:hypothetical protein
VSHAGLEDIDGIISDGGHRPERPKERESAGVRTVVV